MAKRVEWKVLGTAIDYCKTLITVNGIVLVASVSLLTTFVKDKIDTVGLVLLALSWLLVLASLVSAYRAVSSSINASSREEKILDDFGVKQATDAAAPAATPPIAQTGGSPSPAAAAGDEASLPVEVWNLLHRVKYLEEWPQIAKRANMAASMQLGAFIFLAFFGFSHVLAARFSLETELDAAATFIKNTKNLPTKPQIVSFERDDKAGVYHLVYQDAQEHQYRCDLDFRLAAMRKCY